MGRSLLHRLLEDLASMVLTTLVVGGALLMLAPLHWLLMDTLGAPWWLLALPVELWLFVVALCLVIWLIRLPVGRLQPGKHRFASSRQGQIWLIHFGLLRILHFPLWKSWIYGLSTLRWLALRALGCRNAFDLDTSADAVILDPSLHRFGPGSQIGSGAVVGGHILAHGFLRLEGVELGAGVQLHTRCLLGPGCRIEDEVELGPYTQVAGRCRIGARSQVGANCSIGQGAQIGREVILGDFVVLEPRVEIGDGARVEAHTVVPVGTLIEAGSHFPSVES